MLTLGLATLLFALAPATQDSAPEDPRRQFDFWIGEWSVQNRFLKEADGTFRDADVTRARITPLCGGGAILEEWAGPYRGTFMNGFSLRAWHPEEERWQLLLFWTTNGDGGFGQLSGHFRHGRGEFFTTTEGPKRTRYSFSDALPNTVRWDSAHTQDAGVTWKTDWIMEFSRTRAANDVTQDDFFEIDWTTGKLSPHAQARELDWMIGTWEGTQVDDSGDRKLARLRCKTVVKDCLLVEVLETRWTEEDAWGRGEVRVRGFVPRRGQWESWSLVGRFGILRRSLGKPKDGAVEFTRAPSFFERIRRVEEGAMLIEEGREPLEGESRERVRLTTHLRRVENR